jgi:hypothetical protein
MEDRYHLNVFVEENSGLRFFNIELYKNKEFALSMTSVKELEESDVIGFFRSKHYPLDHTNIEFVTSDVNEEIVRDRASYYGYIISPGNHGEFYLSKFVSEKPIIVFKKVDKGELEFLDVPYKETMQVWRHIDFSDWSGEESRRRAGNEITG